LKACEFSVHLDTALIPEENELIFDSLPSSTQPFDPQPRVRKLDVAAEMLVQRERIVRHGDLVTPNAEVRGAAQPYCAAASGRSE